LRGGYFVKQSLQVSEKILKEYKPECSRCGNLEDEMLLFFLCPFSKTTWFTHPWYIKIEALTIVHHNVPDMLQALLSLGHPQIYLSSLYTFL
jgi:hypothetical protein